MNETRQEWATRAVREAIATVTELALTFIGPDDDLVDDLHLDALEFVSLTLIIEEIFSIDCPDPAHLFETSYYRSAASLAEWALRQSDAHGWNELNQQRRRA